MGVDKYKGVVELEIGGALRGFKFGTRAMSLFCNYQKIPFSQVEKYMEDNNDNVDVTVIFFWCGAVAYARLFKKEEPSIDEVYAWVDEGVMNTLNGAMKEMAPNEEAPNQPGQE